MANNAKTPSTVLSSVLKRLIESQGKTGRIEAYGTKGMKSTPWRKIFKNAEALQKWCERNDTRPDGYRELEEGE